MTADELLAALRPHPTESQLSELTTDYVIAHMVGPDDGLLGWIFVPVSDGLLGIPYEQVSVGHGWEQLCPDRARCFGQDASLARAVRAYDAARQGLDAALNAALIPAPDRDLPEGA